MKAFKKGDRVTFTEDGQQFSFIHAKGKMPKSFDASKDSAEYRKTFDNFTVVSNQRSPLVYVMRDGYIDGKSSYHESFLQLIEPREMEPEPVLTTYISVKVTDDLLARIDAKAEKEKVSRAEVVRKILERYF